jgi:hypothetical protein
MARFDRDSFLSHVFHPNKVSRPTGLRKTSISGKGWKASRRNSFNRMDAVKQRTIKESGTLTSYLKGETTLADAKRKLRPEAIQKGIAKPPRVRGKANSDATIIEKLLGLANHRPDNSDHHGTIDRETVTHNVRDRMSGEQKAKAMGLSSYEELVEEATDDNNLDADGRNPFWYHD